MRSKYYIILILSLIVSSCGEYTKLLKSTDNDLKKTKAKEYFEAGQYVKSTELLAQILPRFKATTEAEELNWINAQAYYGMKQYELAGTYFKNLVEEYPFGKYAEEATYMAAKCDFNMSPRPELDQENTRRAIEGFNVFRNRYPNSTRIDECNTLTDVLQERLVEKSYMSAKLYYDMKEYKAAITALDNSLKEFSDTKFREEMMFLKLNSTYLYAVNSFLNRQRERYQAALDDYYSFVEEFPQTRYEKEVKKIYQGTADFLKVDSNNSVVNNIQ